MLNYNQQSLQFVTNKHSGNKYKVLPQGNYEQLRKIWDQTNSMPGVDTGQKQKNET